MVLAKLDRDIARAYRAFARQTNPQMADVSADRASMFDQLAVVEERAAQWLTRDFGVR